MRTRFAINYNENTVSRNELAEVCIKNHDKNENVKIIKKLASFTAGHLGFLLLLLDRLVLTADCRAVFALMLPEDLLHLEEALAAELILGSLLALLVAGIHDLSSTARELWHHNLLLLRLLLLFDYNIIMLLQIGILPLGSVPVL
mgnify:CR=1 FL=1